MLLNERSQESFIKDPRKNIMERVSMNFKAKDKYTTT